jgi:triphosphatase
MALEQEIKLVVNSNAKLDLMRLAFLKPLIDGSLSTHHLVSTYFDTPNKHLSQQKVGLRMRKMDDAWYQTVKTAGVAKDGLHQRQEWEHSLAGPEWDLTLLKQTPLDELIDDEQLWLQLAPVFTTDFNRDALQLKMDEGSLVELAYDYGEVIAGDKTAPIHELELELKSGDVNALHTLAKQLKAELDISPSDRSKAQMGYELASR